MGAVFELDAIGTHWAIETREPLPDAVRSRIVARIDEFDVIYSRFRRDSLVSRVAAASKGGRFGFPEDAVPLFDLYDQLHVATAGAVDPLVGRDLELLGYDADYSLTPVSESVRAEEHASGRPCWSTDVLREGNCIVTQRPLVIDVGAIGKGYLVDALVEILRADGVIELVVDASGDLRSAGGNDLRIGLEHPCDPGRIIGIANVRDRALCASAVNRRAWGEGIHHVLDARTGVPVRDVVATWVVADDAATADGLATALFFASPDDLVPDVRFGYVRMFADGRAECSANFDGELFS
jgi:thiamine biosynthesis lipoprotein